MVIEREGIETRQCRIWRKRREKIADRTRGGDWGKIGEPLTSWSECVQLSVEATKEELWHWLKSINVQQNTVYKASWKLLELLRSRFGIKGFSVIGLLKRESILDLIFGVCVVERRCFKRRE